MRYFVVIILGLSGICFVQTCAMAQENKTKPAPVYTLLGTIKGEVTKVSDGGKKIEVKYKELVTSARSTANPYFTRGSTSAKFRPPQQKELYFKEKNQELDLRLVEKTVVRVLDTSDLPAESDKKKKGGVAKKDDDDDASDDDMKKEKQEKGKSKAEGKTNKKSSDQSLPGKAGDPGSLVKGQYVIVTVYREDLPGFNRLIAGSIYILGEK